MRLYLVGGFSNYRQVKWLAGLNKIIVDLLLLMMIFSEARAATLITFDDPNLFMVRHDVRLYGYYRLSLPDAGIRGPVSCAFFIEVEPTTEKGTGTLVFNTYTTNRSFDKRDFGSDLPGDLEIIGDRWSFRMDRMQGGDYTAAGGDFRRQTAGPSTVMNTSEIIGVFTIKKKTSLFVKGTSGFRSKGAYLLPGDVVIALKNEKMYYFVTYFNSATSRHSTGWVSQ